MISYTQRPFPIMILRSQRITICNTMISIEHHTLLQKSIKYRSQPCHHLLKQCFQQTLLMIDCENGNNLILNFDGRSTVFNQFIVMKDKGIPGNGVDVTHNNLLIN